MNAQQSNRANNPSRSRAKNPQSPCVVERSIRRSGLSRDSFVRILTQTAFSRLKFWTQTDLERLLFTAESLGLSPLSEDIYAAPTLSAQDLMTDDWYKQQSKDPEHSSAPITLVLSLQGWMRLINSQPQFHGVSFNEPEFKSGQLPDWMECSIYRRDREVATTIREYMGEVNLMSGAWITHPRRMLRHKCLIQCAKLAFGFPLSLTIESDNLHASAKSSNKLPKGINQSEKRRPLDCSDLKSWLTRPQQNV
jgi:hypothetical protein